MPLSNAPWITNRWSLQTLGFLTARESLLKEIGMNLLKSPPIKLNSMPKLSFDPSGTKQSSIKYLYVHAFFSKAPGTYRQHFFPRCSEKFYQRKEHTRQDGRPTSARVQPSRSSSELRMDFRNSNTLCWSHANPTE